MELNDLNRQIQNIITEEIRSDEKILWVDQPDPNGIMWSKLPIFLFAIPWTAFAVFWMYGAAGFGHHKIDGPGALFPLFGLPFLFIGFGMLLSPFWFKNIGLKSAYVLTTKRVICFNKAFRAYEINSYRSELLEKMKKVVHSNGLGDLIFEEIDSNSESNSNYMTKRIGCFGIRNVTVVEDLIRATLISIKEVNTVTSKI